MAVRPQSPVPWHQLLDLLLARRVDLAGDICQLMQRQLSAYRDVPLERFHRYVAMAMESTIRLAGVVPPTLSSAQTAVLEQVGEAQAHIGVPVDQMLLAWRIGTDRLMEQGIAEAERLELATGEVLGFIRGTLGSADVGMATTARAHRRAELERDREAQDRRATFVRAVLSGTVEPGQLRARAKSYGLDPTTHYRAVRAQRVDAVRPIDGTPRGGGEPPADGGSRHELARSLGLSAASAAGRGMSVLVDGDLAGFQVDPPGEVAPARAGVGPAVPLEQLAESFRLATRALHTLRAFGLAGTADLPWLGLRAAVVADADVSAALRRRYLQPLEDAGSGAEILATLRAYLAAGSHVDTTAERLHIHANTVRYRLARFAELTGAHLRDPLVAFEVWWAVESAAINPD